MPKKILIVEHSEYSREALRTLVEMEGYEATAASSTPEACRKAEEWLPDLVLLDFFPGGIDGQALPAASFSSRKMLGFP